MNLENSFKEEKEKMHSRFSVKSQLTLCPPLPLARVHHHHQAFFTITCCEKSSSSSSSSDPKFRFKLLGRSLGDSKWKFNGIDTSEFLFLCDFAFLLVILGFLNFFFCLCHSFTCSTSWFYPSFVLKIHWQCNFSLNCRQIY